MSSFHPVSFIARKTPASFKFDAKYSTSAKHYVRLGAHCAPLPFVKLYFAVWKRSEVLDMSGDQINRVPRYE